MYRFTMDVLIVELDDDYDVTSDFTPLALYVPWSCTDRNVMVGLCLRPSVPGEGL